jgi:hypothetical protein
VPAWAGPVSAPAAWRLEVVKREVEVAPGGAPRVPALSLEPLEEHSFGPPAWQERGAKYEAERLGCAGLVALGLCLVTWRAVSFELPVS